MTTAAGWWNAPTRFLPAAALIAVLPPTELSTCASSVVGTWTKRQPRRRIAAANPVRSPTTPPPSAMTASPRSTPRVSSVSTTVSSVRQFFCPSPGVTISGCAVSPAAASDAVSAGR